MSVRAFFIPNPAKYPLIIVSEYAVRTKPLSRRRESGGVVDVERKG
jgi:hypothetical protein